MGGHWIVGVTLIDLPSVPLIPTLSSAAGPEKTIVPPSGMSLESPVVRGGKEREEEKRVRREEKKPRAHWFGYPPPRNFSTKSESIVVVTPMVAMEEAMDSNVSPS